MSYQSIEVHNSIPHIGAEIRGVDLSNPLGNQQFQEVHHALMDRLVIFFRDQKLGIEQHKDFARRFGKLHMHPASPNVIGDPLRFLLSRRTTRPSTLPARIGTRTYRATPSRRWARSSILPKCPLTAAATPCSPTCISRTRCCRSRSASSLMGSQQSTMARSIIVGATVTTTAEKSIRVPSIQLFGRTQRQVRNAYS